MYVIFKADAHETTSKSEAALKRQKKARFASLSDKSALDQNPGGTSLCRVYGYVPPTRVDFSLPKIQNRPQILKFYSRTGPTF